VTPLLGTPQSSAEFMDPITENIKLGSTEVWQIFNTTADTHPIHLHQVAYQVLTRQMFSTKLVNLGVSDSGVTKWGMSRTRFTSAPVLARGNEQAWKDTIQLNPGEVITLRATFDIEGKYVTHCHILSHEEHDMMRYMQVGDTAYPPPAFVIDSSGTLTAPAPASAALFSGRVSVTDPTAWAQPVARDGKAPSLVEELLV
jgi:hypothetical protein